ncbi:MAG: HAMP domain-containing histidine kinase [Hyphomonas sp.]|jgi:signal transduction histidine kinase|nr:HAMP domain-containing histidine kinase [Hyphomonas sp.]
MGGGAAIIGALVLAGIGLTYLFDRHIMRSLGDDLEVHLRQLLAAVELNAAGQPQLRREPADPRFNEPLSGLYWQLGTVSGVASRSRSLWDTALRLPPDEQAPGEVHYHRLAGPAQTELLSVERTVFLTANGERMPVRAAVAADLARIKQARRDFVRELVPSLALLATALAAAAWVQIGLGLRPLVRIREGIAAIRTGRSGALEGAVPSEVEPLMHEINHLISAQEKDLERARGRAADLAHGLKTPLSALSSDVRALRARGENDIANRIEQVGEAMRRHIERELARARIRGKRGFQAQGTTAVLPLLESLVAIQRRTSAGERIDFVVEVDGGSTVAMDKADLAEVLGNLLENAGRHARSLVKVSMTNDGRLAVDDDGRGVPPNARDLVITRGKRLDEQSEGSGLGLAIVQDILEAYDRRLTLETSALGGLRVVL